MAPRLIADDIRELLPMVRRPGHHVSTIVNRMCVANGKYSADRGKPRQIMFEAGNVFEDLMAAHLAARFAKDDPERYIHGMQVERDGITGNLDLFDTHDFAVEECKFTKLSCRHDIAGEKFWQYWAQLKSYCHMLDSPTGRLHICHVMGNWKHDLDDPLSGYQYRLWEDTWTDRELKTHWRMMLANRS